MGQTLRSKTAIRQELLLGTAQSSTVAMSEHHPGSFFGITGWGSESFFEDNSLSIYNSTLALAKWRTAFKKCDFDNSDSIDRGDLADVVQHLYWGRTPKAEEMVDFMLCFNADPTAGKLTWDEFKDCLDNFRRK